MVVSSSQVIRGARRFVLAAALLTSVVGGAHAIEVRHVQGARFTADLTRAYAPCLAPNTFTSTGVPACTPAVTSTCNYTSAGLDLRKREDTNEIAVDAALNNVTGPGNCTVGPFTLKLGLRVTVDDTVCTSGACTLLDLEASIPLVLDGNDFELDDVTLESALPGLPPAIANYEILHAFILAPDGKPIAAAGTEGDNSADVRADMSTAYAVCTAPDTANAWAVPACSAPVWQSACDFDFMDVDVNRAAGQPRLRPRAFGLAGGPACTDGTYTFIPRLRITTNDCGLLCTVVDLDVPLFATAERGDLPPTTLLIASDPLAVGVGFVSDDDQIELLGLTARDPSGDLLAGIAVTPTLRLDRTRVAASYHDNGNPNDDGLNVKAEFPFPPLDPTVAGATFTLAGKAGAVFTATLPAATWEVRTPGRYWVYRDELGTVNGVERAEIKRFSRAGLATGFKVRMTARNASAGATNLSALNVVVTVGGGGGPFVATDNVICRPSTNRLSCK